MQCPKCRSEVGNLSVCPYCGGTVYLDNATWDMGGYTRMNPTAYQQPRRTGKYLPDPGVDRKLRSMETKLNLLLVLQGGTFMLMIFVLLLLALK